MMVPRMAAPGLSFEGLGILFFALVGVKLSDLRPRTLWAIFGPALVVAAALCRGLPQPRAEHGRGGVRAAAFAGVFVVYLLAVRTRWGQDFETSALAGARQHRAGDWYGDADRWLNRVTAESFGVSLAVVGAVGLLRRRYLLALCGVLTAG